MTRLRRVAVSGERLLALVRADVLRELEGLDPSSLVLRLDLAADLSVFVVARLGDGSVMIARVYETELQLQPVYLSSEDAEVLVEALSSRPRAELPRARGRAHGVSLDP